jgi:hypothetical protein
LCINKHDRNSRREVITHLGNAAAECSWTREKMIRSIEENTNTFYTLVDGNRGNIGVVHGGNGKFLRTYSDGNWNDNLLSLPEC